MRGRIRSIKPEVLSDEELWDLEAETGLPLYRAFTGLWMYADREGRFEWRPRVLKPAILPHWDGDFSRVLHALSTRGFVVRYVVDGREYGVVRTFKRHQVVNNRELASELPKPPDGYENANESADIDATPTRNARVEHASSTPALPCTSGMGREGNGSGSDASGTRSDPPPSEAQEDLIQRSSPPLHVQLENAWAVLGGLVIDGVAAHRMPAVAQWLQARCAKTGEDPIAVFKAAAERFRADEQAKRKRLGLAVLLSQFEQWCEETAEPAHPPGPAYQPYRGE